MNGTLAWEQALAWRMARHRLVERAEPAGVEDVASDLGGLHAQVMSSAELSLWARIEGLGRDTLADALWRRRALVKLWAMRGTLHLLPSAELGLWLAAFGTYTKFGNAGRPDIDELAAAVGEALHSRTLSRDELADEVERRTASPTFGQWVRHSWGSYLKAASFRGLICFAPGEGTRARFTAPATWVPGGIERPDPGEALRAVTRRFLGAYGPATATELARWWAGSPTRGPAERMVAALGDEVVEVDVDGERAWVLARDVPAIAAAPARRVARLLPAFDPWVLGAARRAPALDPAHAVRVWRPQGWVSPTLLVDGRLAGVWRHRMRRRDVTVELDPFGAVPAWARERLEGEARRLASFLDRRLVLAWKD